MTDADKSRSDSLENMRPSTSALPFNPADLVSMRVKPAFFARMCGVSKTAVSKWIHEGKVTLGPDGLLDPVVASRQVFERTDPARLRARVFRQAVEPYGKIQERMKELEQELSEIKSLRRFYLHMDEIEQRRNEFLGCLEFEFQRLIDAYEAGVLDKALDHLWATTFLGLQEQQLKADQEESLGVTDA